MVDNYEEDRDICLKIDLNKLIKFQNYINSLQKKIDTNESFFTSLWKNAIKKISEKSK